MLTNSAHAVSYDLHHLNDIQRRAPWTTRHKNTTRNLSHTNTRTTLDTKNQKNKRKQSYQSHLHTYTHIHGHKQNKNVLTSPLNRLPTPNQRHPRTNLLPFLQRMVRFPLPSPSLPFTRPKANPGGQKKPARTSSPPKKTKSPENSCSHAARASIRKRRSRPACCGTICIIPWAKPPG